MVIQTPVQLCMDLELSCFASGLGFCSTLCYCRGWSSTSLLFGCGRVYGCGLGGLWCETYKPTAALTFDQHVFAHHSGGLDLHRSPMVGFLSWGFACPMERAWKAHILKLSLVRKPT